MVATTIRHYLGRVGVIVLALAIGYTASGSRGAGAADTSPTPLFLTPTSGYVGYIDNQPKPDGTVHAGFDICLTPGCPADVSSVGPGNTVYAAFDGKLAAIYSSDFTPVTANDSRAAIVVMEHENVPGLPVSPVYSWYMHLADEYSPASFVNPQLQVDSYYPAGSILGRQGNRRTVRSVDNPIGTAVTRLGFELHTVRDSPRLETSLDPSPVLGINVNWTATTYPHVAFGEPVGANVAQRVAPARLAPQAPLIGAPPLVLGIPAPVPGGGGARPSAPASTLPMPASVASTSGAAAPPPPASMASTSVAPAPPPSAPAPPNLVAARAPGGVSAPAQAIPAPGAPAAGSAPVPAHVHADFQATRDCWPSGTPLGALPPAIPIWCTTLNTGPATFTQGTNSWLDEFQHGLSNADLGAGYRAFDTQEAVYKTQHFRHNDHWMMDLAPLSPTGAGLLGGGMMRPDRSFRFENGKLVVEADVAAGIADYGGDAWAEIVVTTAPAPTGNIPDALYAYGQFGGYWSFGCRLHPDRTTTCALYKPDRTTSDPCYFCTAQGRVFEISAHQWVGSQVYGGAPYSSEGLDRVWRLCQGTDPDLNCRDRFRLELTKTSVTIYVNGTLYFQQSGLPVGAQFPDAFVNGDLYAYFAGWEVRATAQTIRYHWDRLAINPSTGPSAPPIGTPPPATPIPTACTPRPNVSVTTSSAGPGSLRVTVAAQGTNNQLSSLQFGGTPPHVSTNDLVDIPAMSGSPPVAAQTGRSGTFAVTLPAGTQSVTFSVRKATASAATTVYLVATDGCGPWPTFVGLGANA